MVLNHSPVPLEERGVHWRMGIKGPALRAHLVESPSILLVKLDWVTDLQTLFHNFRGISDVPQVDAVQGMSPGELFLRRIFEMSGTGRGLHASDGIPYYLISCSIFPEFRR